MVEASEFQKGEKHMLRKVIMLSNHHKNKKAFVKALEEILVQHDNVFQEEYLESY